MQEIKMNGESLNIEQENIAKLKEIFPEVFNEDKIDFEKLQNVLGHYIDTDEEKYRFTWNGKMDALRLSQTPSTGTLRPCKEESRDWDTTQNLYIEGDNLEVLKLLQNSYLNKIKMIYIDPPYNTGNDFVYKDDFKDNITNYKKKTGQINSDGNSTSTNKETDGRYHTNWLNMMYPRLRLARNLLTDDGVIFISIDDNEVTNLRKLCDEVFGEENFIGKIMPVANPGGRDYKQIAVCHEYLLVYVKSFNSLLNEIPKDVNFAFFDISGGYEPRDLRNRNPKFHRGNRPNLFYPFFVNPKCHDNYGYYEVSLDKKDDSFIEVLPLNSEGKESVWRLVRTKAAENIVNGKPESSQIIAKLKNDGLYTICEKCRKHTTKVKSIWAETEMRTENGTRELRALLDNTYFNHPKPLSLIKRCCILGTETNDIILDFFSGSATTAHAVIQLNTEDGGNRKFICVQLPEITDEKSEAFKAGYKNICEIGIERIRRTGDKIKEEIEQENQQLKLGEEPKKVPDIGFKVFKLDSSNIRKWNPDTKDLERTLLDQVDNFVEGRKEEDALYEIILKNGLPLTVPVEELNVKGKKVYSIGMGAMIVCLDNNITLDIADEIAKISTEFEDKSMVTVVFKDNGFENDSVKTNIKETLRGYGIGKFVTV